MRMAAAVAVLFLPVSCLAQFHIDSGARQMLASPDKAFAMQAHQSSLGGVQFGKLATQKAATPELKEFGAQLADVYGQLSNKLEAIVSSDKMFLARVISAKDQTKYDKLAKLSGAAFDKAYAKQVLKTQKAAVKRYARQTKKGKEER